MSEHSEYCCQIEDDAELIVIYLDAIARALVRTNHPDLPTLLSQIQDEYQLDARELNFPAVFQSHLAETHSAFCNLVLRHRHRSNELPPL